MDLEAIKEKLVIEEKALLKLQEESCNLDNMNLAQRWEVLLPSITLALEKTLREGNTDGADEEEEEEPMSESETMAILTDVRMCVDKQDFLQAFKLASKTEKLFPGASELRYCIEFMPFLFF